MTHIYFTQYLRPNGRKIIVAIDRPDPVVAKADHILRNGFRFEIEELITGQVHMSISDDNGDYSNHVCDNGPYVPAEVDTMILSFDVAKALKEKAANG